MQSHWWSWLQKPVHGPLYGSPNATLKIWLPGRFHHEGRSAVQVIWPAVQRPPTQRLPSLSKCLAKRPSLRAKSMNVTCSFDFGLTNQSSFTAGLPCSDSRSLIRSPLRGS